MAMTHRQNRRRSGCCTGGLKILDTCQAASAISLPRATRERRFFLLPALLPFTGAGGVGGVVSSSAVAEGTRPLPEAIGAWLGDLYLGGWAGWPVDSIDHGMSGQRARRSKAFDRSFTCGGTWPTLNTHLTWHAPRTTEESEQDSPVNGAAAHASVGKPPIGFGSHGWTHIDTYVACFEGPKGQSHAHGRSNIDPEQAIIG